MRADAKRAGIHQTRIYVATSPANFQIRLMHRKRLTFDQFTQRRYLELVSFGASEATICSKRESPRSGSQKGNNFSKP
jgi:hypothetical protein